jgi:hypothetical protein
MMVAIYAKLLDLSFIPSRLFLSLEVVVVDGRGRDAMAGGPSFWRYITRGTTLAIPLRWLVCERLEVSLCPLLHSAAPRARKSIAGNIFRVWREIVVL